MPGAPSSVLAPSKASAPSSVLAPSSIVVRLGAPSTVLVLVV